MRRSSFRLVLASGVAVAFALLSPFHLQAQYVYVNDNNPGSGHRSALQALQTCVACGDPWSELRWV
jgi:hypothetical protein